MAIQTAFQIGAFQFNAFQEGLALGGGGRDWRAFLLAQSRAARRRKTEEKKQPEPITALRLVPLRISIPAAPVYHDLSAIASRLIVVPKVDEELEEFRAFMEALAEMEEIA